MDLAALGEALAEGATHVENNSRCAAASVADASENDAGCATGFGAAGPDGSEDDACCAICLGALDTSADIALVKSCLHPFCVECITAWASSRCVPSLDIQPVSAC